MAFYLLYGRYLDYLSRKKADIIIPKELLECLWNEEIVLSAGMLEQIIFDNKESHPSKKTEHSVEITNFEDCRGCIEVTISDSITFDVSMDSVYKKLSEELSLIYRVEKNSTTLYYSRGVPENA